ncbi:T9SS type A sorting domain-containing protein [Pontibacter ruber]|uniref:T9SS type A sorting domain-containing protein n=1 Tax=Pontibacter ruber TaxID=1343895 RepID=A0ABW5D3W7_9BACT|nr:T9SS type A sorting domain-containing protein [Pontibacter ruber]
MAKISTSLILLILILPLKLSAQFSSLTNLKQEATTINTGDRPQSKVWSYDCYHWAVFSNATGTHLWRLDDDSWTKMLTISDQTDSKADCKVVDNVVHVFLYQGITSRLVSLEYDSAAYNYKYWTNRTSAVTITLDNEVETATIDIDGNGRMWLASDGVDDINVRWSDSPYKEWSEPILLAKGIHADDISAVVALPGKVGVIWSNQNIRRFGFKLHNDGDDPATWSEDEIPASQSALDIGKGMANDHINMAVAKDGTLYCAIKTEYRKEYERLPYPLVSLIVRRPSGTWDNLYEVNNRGTRPIVLLNEDLGKLRVVYTSADAGGKIVYRETSTNNISFGEQYTLIEGFYNNPTSMKSNPGSEVVILASDDKYVAGVLASDNPSPSDACNISDTFTVYPNPFASTTTLHFLFRKATDYTIDLYDSKGSFIATIGKGRAEARRENTLELNGEFLSRGLYMIRLQAESESKSLKLIYNK